MYSLSASSPLLPTLPLPPPPAHPPPVRLGLVRLDSVAMPVAVGEAPHRLAVPLLGRLPTPLRRLCKIPLDPVAATVTKGEVILCFAVTLLGRLPLPRHSLRLVPLHPVAVSIAIPNIALRITVPRLGRFPVPLHSLSPVLLDPGTTLITMRLCCAFTNPCSAASGTTSQPLPLPAPPRHHDRNNGRGIRPWCRPLLLDFGFRKPRQVDLKSTTVLGQARCTGATHLLSVPSLFGLQLLGKISPHLKRYPQGITVNRFATEEAPVHARTRGSS